MQASRSINGGERRSERQDRLGAREKQKKYVPSRNVKPIRRFFIRYLYMVLDLTLVQSIEA